MQNLIYEKNDGVGTLIFNRPKSLNALNSEVMAEFTEFLEQADQDPSLRCLILTGAGEKAFIAGADIKEMSEMNASQGEAFSKAGHKVLLKIQSLKFPVIAAVNGFALGGGCEMAMACDFIIASENSSFGLPEVGPGLLPGFGGTQRLSRFVGLARASEMIFTGRRYSAAEAEKFGLVNKVVPLAQLLTTAQEIAKEIALKAPVAVASARRLLNQGESIPIEQGLKIEGQAFGELFNTRDQKEGTKSFIEKRSPKFVGE